MGVSWAEAARMPWSMCRMLFEARAEAYEATSRHGGEDVRHATASDYSNWI